MTAKHQTPEWQKTAKLIRAQVKQAWSRGDEPTCWRCGRPIYEGEPFDVGHIDRLADDNSPNNAAPEHRQENRREGGRVGARMTNAAKGGSTFQALPWA